MLSVALSACGGMIVFDTKRRPNNIFDEALSDTSGDADQVVNRRILQRFPPGSDVDELVGYLTSMESRCRTEIPINHDIIICENSSWEEIRVVSVVFLVPFESDRQRFNHRYFVKIFSANGKTQGVYVWHDSPAD